MLAMRDRTPSRSVMSISSACLSTSKAWMAALAVEIVVEMRALFCCASSAGRGASTATGFGSSRLPAITLSATSVETGSVESGRRRASRRSLSAMTLPLVQSAQCLAGRRAYARVGVDLEELEVGLRGRGAQRSERLGRRHPGLPVAVLQRGRDDRHRGAGADPAQRPAADHTLAARAALEE